MRDLIVLLDMRHLLVLRRNYILLNYKCPRCGGMAIYFFKLIQPLYSKNKKLEVKNLKKLIESNYLEIDELKERFEEKGLWFIEEN